MTSTPLDIALKYADIRWPIFPCGADKKPLTTHGFKDATLDAAQIDRWWRRWPTAQIGVDCGAAGICVVDLDLSADKDGIAAFAELAAARGPHGCSLIASTPRGGRHLVYAMPDPPVGCSIGIVPGVDVRAAGGYVVLPGPSSPGREWALGDPFERWTDDDGNPCSHIEPMPEWVREFVSSSKPPTHSPANDSTRTIPIDAKQLAAIKRALAFIDPDPRPEWVRVGMSLKSTSAGSQARELWDEWSRQSGKFDIKTQDSQWASFREYRLDGSEVTIASLFHMAMGNGYTATLEDELLAASVEVEEIDTPGGEAPSDSQSDAPTSRIEVANSQSDAPSSQSKPQSGAKFPEHLLDCHGLVGEMASWMLKTSTQRQPALCLASAIVTCGALVGRKVCTSTNLRTNIYALGIGETGCGKDPSVSRPVTLFTHAGCRDFIGPGEWKSDSGLRAALTAHPSHVCLIDEFVKVLRNLSGDRTPPHLLGIKRYILELFSRAGGVHLPAAYADRKLHAPDPINEPNLGIYGVGVPSDLFAAMDRGAIQDGFLNRFLVFMADDQLPPRQDITATPAPPEHLVELTRAVHTRHHPPEAKKGENLAGIGSGMATASGVKVITMHHEARALVRAIEASNDDRMRGLQKSQNPLANLWNRFAEHVQKVALVRATCDDRAREIAVADIEWAHGLVDWCMTRTHEEAEQHVSDSKIESETKRVLRAISRAGSSGLSGNKLCRATQWLSRSARKDIIQTLSESGQIAVQQVAGKTKPTTRYVAVVGGGSEE